MVLPGAPLVSFYDGSLQVQLRRSDRGYISAGPSTGHTHLRNPTGSLSFPSAVNRAVVLGEDDAVSNTFCAAKLYTRLSGTPLFEIVTSLSARRHQ